MALTTVGFAGEVSDAQDAVRSKFQGVSYPVVADLTDFQVTINGGATRTVNIAAGVAWAHGVQVTNDTTATVALDTVATAGQTRWDAIVLRRDWSAGTATLTKVNGTAALSAPMVVPTLNNNPGVLHDQLLALAQVTNGVIAVTSVDPRRGWASKVLVFPTVGALPPAAAVPYGTTAALTNGTGYRRLLDSGSSPVWLPTGSGGQVELSSVFTAATGWTVSGLANRALTNTASGDVQLNLQIRRAAGAATLIAHVDHGNFADSLIGSVAVALSPTEQRIPVPLQYAADPAFVWSAGMGQLQTDGQLWLESGAPGLDLYARTGSTDVSIRAHIRFTRKV